MSWLTPLGFLGLIGVAVLVIIYIIKPNYQNKRISSTFVWQRSMQYKKKTIPISRIQNLLVFICQLLILAILGTLLAGPVIAEAVGGDKNEVVLVIDASCGMRISDEGESRFERAVKAARSKAADTYKKGSTVSVIVADSDPEFLFTREGAENSEDALGMLDALLNEGVGRCDFGEADMEKAVTLAESVLSSNTKAGIYLYTGTDYTYHNGVETVNIASDNEWNATILGVRAELDNDNHYEITVDAACYGKTDFITVACEVYGANGDPDSVVKLEKGEFFDPSDEEKSVVFTSDDITSGAIYSYDYISAYVSVRDSFADDNSFFLYGGARPIIKVQYASSSPNNFFESAVRSLREFKKEVFDVQFTSLKENEVFATEGFDLYIFEHKMPDVLPTDGVVLLVDPRTAPIGSELQIGDAYRVDSGSILSPGSDHELTKYTDPTRITIAKYNDILLNEGYEELMFYNGRPVMLLRDTAESKVIVWAFDLNFSNIIALPDFSILIYNMFNYFIPETMEKSSFEVGDTAVFNGRGSNLTVTGNGEEYVFDGGVGEIALTRPGTYAVNQTSIGGDALAEERFFVKIPSSESDTSKTVDALPSVAVFEAEGVGYQDLLFYFSIALVTLLFAEWVLEIKKNY